MTANSQPKALDTGMRYRKFFLVSFFLFPFLSASAQENDMAPLSAISSLDISRYMGLWYEIAKFPNRFQQQCASEITTEYKLLDEGRIEVGNRCKLANGDSEYVVGIARQIGSSDSPKLQVRFAPALLSLIPGVWGDYWIIDLDSDYQVVAISEPQREYLWILARSPQIDAETYSALVTRLQAKGLSTDKLEHSLSAGTD